MTPVQQRKILIRIQQTEKEIEELKKVRSEILSNGYASASISSTGGSKSYTRIDVDKITKSIIQLQKELEQLNSMLVTGSAGDLNIKSILHVYC